MIKWVVRFAFIAVGLGFIGTLIMIFSITEKQDEVFNNAARKRNSIVKTPTKNDTGSIRSKPEVLQDTLSRKEIEDRKTSDSANRSLREEIKKKEVYSIAKEKNEKTFATPGDNKVNPTNLTGKEKKQESKFLAKKELQQIIRRINTVKEKTDNFSNCIQIVITEKGNNRKAAAQIVDYIKHKQFTIAGREMTDKNVNGIKIITYGKCIRLIVGTLQ